MGTEGHDSPRDVASKKQKHPWEVFPDDGTSAEISEKKREEKTRKIKEWVGSHKVLIFVIALVMIALIAAGIFAIYKINEINAKKEQEKEQQTSTHHYVFPEDFKIKDALTVQQAYSYTRNVIRKKIALAGVDPENPDPIKIEDNMNAYIETLDSDYEKVYYRLYTIYLMFAYNYPERAQFLLSNFEFEHRELDRQQLCLYYDDYAWYYESIGDDAKHKEYAERIVKECRNEELYYDEDTGEIIEDMDAYMEKYKGKNGGENQ